MKQSVPDVTKTVEDVDYERDGYKARLQQLHGRQLK